MIRFYIESIIRFIFWLLGFWFLWKIPLCNNNDKSKKNKISLPEEKEQPDRKLSDIRLSVIIPARNEEKTLPILLESLSIQTFKPCEIIVVNDQSTDETGNIAKKYNVKVVNIDNLPEGWMGKTWACFSGARISSGNIFMFIDSDTFLEKDGLKKILLSYIKSGGVISIQPYHKIKKFYENFASYFNLILMGSMNAFTPFQRKLKPIGAFGPCLMCNREDYLKIGGHSSVKNKIVEDLEIGKKFMKANIPVYCFGGRNSINFRMYPYGIGSLMNGFAKGFTIGARSMSVVNLILVILWITGSFYPLTLLIGSMVNFVIIEFLAGLGFYLIYALQVFWMLKRIGNFNLAVPIFFPVFMLFFVGVFFWSIILSMFKLNVKWKGRNINKKD